MDPDLSTFGGVLVAVFALLPGAAYVWSFERQAGAFGVSFADRVLRFLAASVVIHVVLAIPEYVLYRWALRGEDRIDALQFGVVWGWAVVLFAVPALVGSVLGGLWKSRYSRFGWAWIRDRVSADAERKLLKIVLGPDPAPRAWDNIFSARPNVYLRIRTVEGTWLAGLFAADSYVAGFPHEPDLYLEQAYSLDENTLELTDPCGYSLYIPADQIAWFELVPPAEEATP